jgi:hypothetical protein
MRSIIILTLFAVSTSFARNKSNKTPTVQDLDFLIGTWDVAFHIYDTHNPGSKPIFTEKGYETYEYALGLNGVPMFIICTGELVRGDGKGKKRIRQFQESIRYGRFVHSFEQIGLYSNWPGTGLETLEYDSVGRTIISKGQLAVQYGMLERCQDFFQFNDDYSYYEHTNYEHTNQANFSDMSVLEFNLTSKSIGQKRN